MEKKQTKMKKRPASEKPKETRSSARIVEELEKTDREINSLKNERKELQEELLNAYMYEERRDEWYEDEEQQ